MRRRRRQSAQVNDRTEQRKKKKTILVNTHGPPAYVRRTSCRHAHRARGGSHAAAHERPPQAAGRTTYIIRITTGAFGVARCESDPRLSSLCHGQKRVVTLLGQEERRRALRGGRELCPFAVRCCGEQFCAEKSSCEGLLVAAAWRLFSPPHAAAWRYLELRRGWVAPLRSAASRWASRLQLEAAALSRPTRWKGSTGLQPRLHGHACGWRGGERRSKPLTNL